MYSDLVIFSATLSSSRTCKCPELLFSRNLQITFILKMRNHSSHPHQQKNIIHDNFYVSDQMRAIVPQRLEKEQREKELSLVQDCLTWRNQVLQKKEPFCEKYTHNRLGGNVDIIKYTRVPNLLMYTKHQNNIPSIKDLGRKRTMALE